MCVLYIKFQSARFAQYYSVPDIRNERQEFYGFVEEITPFVKKEDISIQNVYLAYHSVV